jgi:hypothetical protein
LEPGTITGLELPALLELVRGATSGRDPAEETSGRDPAEEPAPDDLDKVPPLVPYMVGR